MDKETRKERFAKYRREILSTPDDKFPNSSTNIIVSSDKTSLNNANRPSFALSYGESLSALTDIASSSSKDGESPYQKFLSRKRIRLVLKFVLLGLCIVGMTLWYISFN